MQCTHVSRRVAMLALALTAFPAFAQDAGTLSITGTFRMDANYGSVGPDLAAIYAGDNDHWWRLTLQGVAYSRVHDHREWETGYFSEYVTRVHATSFKFEFFGPESDILNDIVGEQLTAGGLAGGAFLELINGDQFDWTYPEEGGPYAKWNLAVQPSGFGTSFSVGGGRFDPLFATDGTGHPLVQPQRLWGSQSVIDDYRTGVSGLLLSFGDAMDVGSSAPPPFPLPPTLTIASGSVKEGDRGTVALNLPVKLSRASAIAVTVGYRTIDGTAQAGKDYVATTGVLTFAPGEVSRTITVVIKPDQKREPNETFTVELAGAINANIKRGVGTATILNDD